MFKDKFILGIYDKVPNYDAVIVVGGDIDFLVLLTGLVAVNKNVFL